MRTELHRHLDASFRPETLLELSRRFNVPFPFKTVDDVKRGFWLTHQMSNLKEVLDCFVVFQKLLADEAALERVARESVEDCAAEGTAQVELRYSPSYTSEFSGISWQKALAAFQRGVEAGARATGIKAGLICIVSRGYEDALAHRTIEFAVENRDAFIGVDLAGPEVGFPCRMYESVFAKAREAGLPITIHAGEACGPENVWEAIDLLGARRIGHGINSIQDKELLKRLARDGILLETCPTSNWVTRSVAEWKDHPLPRLLEAGVPVSISTDDPGIFGVPLPEEYSRCRNYLGLTERDFKTIDEQAARRSFLK